MTIFEALAPMGCPVSHPPYYGKEPLYITYQSLGQLGQIYAEGQEAETCSSFALNLYFSKLDPAAIQTVKRLLQQAGYVATVDGEIYEAAASRTRIMMTAEREGEQYG